MSISHRSPGRTEWLRPPPRTGARALAFLVALLFLLVSLSAEAKKKKPAAKHKTPAAKHKTPAAKSKGKSKSTSRDLPPPDSAPESDEASSDEKSGAPSKKPAADSGEGEGEEKEKEAKAPPPAPEPEEEAPVRKPPPKAAKTPPPQAEGGDGAGGLSALRFGVGGKALFRNLTWTDSMGMLPPYSLSPGPEAAVWLEAFPAAFATDGFAANIGLYGKFDYGFGASSTTMAGTKLTTKYQDFLVGLKVRIPIGIFIPYLAGGYGMQKFALEPLAVPNNRPNFNYAFINAGGGARIQFTPALDLDIGAGFLYVLNPGKAAGEVGAPDLYPGTTGNGVDASLSIGFRLASMIGIRVGGDFRQFGLATKWKVGDPALQAGGAVDRNISAWGGLEVVFDGVGGGGGGEEGESAPAKKAPPAAKAKKPAPREIEPEETDKDE